MNLKLTSLQSQLDFYYSQRGLGRKVLGNATFITELEAIRDAAAARLALELTHEQRTATRSAQKLAKEQSVKEEVPAQSLDPKEEKKENSPVPAVDSAAELSDEEMTDLKKLLEDNKGLAGIKAGLLFSKPASTFVYDNLAAQCELSEQSREILANASKAVLDETRPSKRGMTIKAGP
jgi:hypothetical protein